MAFLERPNRQACVIDFTGYWETDCIFDYGRQIRQLRWARAAVRPHLLI